VLPVKEVDRDQIRLLARREVAAVLGRERRTWVPYRAGRVCDLYPVTDLIRWLGGDPFIQIGRHAVVNLQAIERVTHYGAVFTAYGRVIGQVLKSPLRGPVRLG
jgi:hypothetical protein